MKGAKDSTVWFVPIHNSHLKIHTFSFLLYFSGWSWCSSHETFKDSTWTGYLDMFNWCHLRGFRSTLFYLFFNASNLRETHFPFCWIKLSFSPAIHLNKLKNAHSNCHDINKWLVWVSLPRDGFLFIMAKWKTIRQHESPHLFAHGQIRRGLCYKQPQ